ncbi:MAG: hypothetical protein K2U26_09665, partial [Cyclobacteriaceae bacterium]|nr:hypothetical protein [Cyclobacteriaceae bacterium]
SVSPKWSPSKSPSNTARTPKPASKSKPEPASVSLWTVIERVRKEAMNLIKSEQVGLQTKSVYLLSEERYQPGTLIPYLQTLPAKSRLPQAIEIYKTLLYIDKRLTGALKADLLNLLKENSSNPELETEPDFLIAQRNKLITLLARDQYYTPNDTTARMLREVLELNRDLVLKFYRDPLMYRPAVPFELNVALQFWLSLGDATPAKIQELIDAVSPMNEQSRKSFNTYYPKGSFEPNGRNPVDFNNGFHTVASLYAAIGNVDGIEWCFSTLVKEGQRGYFELGRMFNTHQNIIGLLYQFGHREKADRVLTWIEKNTTDNPRITVYRNIALRGGYISQFYVGANIEGNAFRSYRGYLYPNLYFAERNVFDQIMEDYEKAIREIKDPNEREFQLAMNGKRKAMFRHKYWFDRQLPVDEKLLDQWLQEAWSHYQNVSAQHLEGKVSSTLNYWGDGVRTGDVARRDLFIYPDYRDGWFSGAYHSDYFYKWLRKTGNASTHFQTGNDLMLLHAWIARAFFVFPTPAPGTIENTYPLSMDVIKDVLTFATEHPQGKSFDKNLLLLILANGAYEAGNVAAGFSYFRQINLAGLEASSNRYEYIEKTFFLNAMKQLCIDLAKTDRMKEAIDLAERFTKGEERVFAYLFMAEKLYQQNANPNAFVYLDSALSYANRVDFTALPQELNSQYNLILLLSRIGSDPINTKALEILREIPEGAKFGAIFARVVGVADEGNFYRARMAIPNTLTEDQDLTSRTQILLEACKKKEALTNNQQWAAFDRLTTWDWYYIFFIPN